MLVDNGHGLSTSDMMFYNDAKQAAKDRHLVSLLDISSESSMQCPDMFVNALFSRVVADHCVCLQIVIAVMHLGRYAVGGETLSVLVSFQILLLWVKIQYFAR